MSGVSLRSLLRNGRTLTAREITFALGPLVLLGPKLPLALPEEDSSWRYLTRHKARTASELPAEMLLDSLVFALRKGPRAAFEGTLLVGRAESNDLRVDDPSVSKLHARVLLGRDGVPLLVDAASTNGTYVDGVRLSAGREARMVPGHQVGFGDVDLRILTAQQLSQVLRSFRPSIRPAG